MIIGNGLIAKAFHEKYANNDDVLIFASGVSNSRNTDTKEFLRERDLLKHYLSQNKMVIYFSTCSIEDISLKDSPYVLHKHELENLIKKQKKFLILRLPQIAGDTSNPNTLLNFICFSIKERKLFNLFSNATRSVIDIDDASKIVSYLIDNQQHNNEVINIGSGIQTSMINLVRMFEEILDLKANYKIIEEGYKYKTNFHESLTVAEKLKIDFSGNYVLKILNKYYRD